MFVFWHRWLQIALAGLVLVGIDLAVFGDTVLFAPLNDPLNLHFFGTVQVAEEVARYQRFTFGVMGGLTAGWGLLAFLVARYALGRREAWAWYGLILSVVLWYAVDGALSAYHGAFANVIGNTLFALPVAVPLIAIRKHVIGRGVRRTAQAAPV